MMHGISDSSVWDRFRKGDRKAFQEIYNKYVPALLNYGSKITSNTELIEDSIQDMFVELWHSGEKLSSTSSIKFYLFKVLRIKINHSERGVGAGNMVSLDGFMTLLRSPSQEDSIIQMEGDSIQMQRLKHIIQLLPERQREAINLRYYHNFSNEEISQIMGVNYHSACKFIYAALKYLKENLKVAVTITFFVILSL